MHGHMSRKEREQQRRREEILDAAEAVFAEKGYVSASMDDVAQRSEFGMGTLYKFFGSKEELYSAILMRKMDEIEPRFKRNLVKDASPIQKLYDHFQDCLNMFWENPRFFRLFFHETAKTVDDIGAGFTPELIDRHKHLLDLMREIFQEGKDNGLFCSLSVDIHNVFFNSIIRGYLVHLSRLKNPVRDYQEETDIWNFYAHSALKNPQSFIPEKHN